jgi:hypothetical protein
MIVRNTGESTPVPLRRKGYFAGCPREISPINAGRVARVTVQAFADAIGQHVALQHFKPAMECTELG